MFDEEKDRKQEEEYLCRKEIAEQEGWCLRNIIREYCDCPLCNSNGG